MPTQPDPITQLPDNPSRNDAPSTFIADADAHVAALDQFTDDVNSAGTVTYNNAVEAAASAQASANSASASALSASESDGYAQNAQASANHKGHWSGLTGAINKPSSVTHDGLDWTLLVNLPDVTASEPGVTSDWQVLNAGDLNVATSSLYAYYNLG